jgi:urease subunit gamma
MTEGLPEGLLRENLLAITVISASFAETVRETEEVVPVNISTWVLPCGVTVGR